MNSRKKVNKSNYQVIQSTKDIIDNYDAFIFDMDGVLWRGSDTLQKSFDALNELKKLGKKIIFLTNNSTVNRQSYLDKLTNLGYTPDIEDIFCASSLAALYLKKNHPDIDTAYVIGQKGIYEELENVGIKGIGMDHKDERNADFNYYGQIVPDPQIKAVVVGIDSMINYYKLAYASACIQHNKALFIATNMDKNIWVGKNKIPGGGTLVTALHHSQGVEPINTGKPNPLTMELICKQFNLKKKQCIMVGDNLDTDIMFGINSKIDTLLVLTGVTDQDMLDKSKIRPKYVLNELNY